MPYIYQLESASERGNHVTICKTDERSKHDKPKLAAANKVPLPHQVDFVNHFASPKFISPSWLLWGMGSGKSFSALLCALELFKMGIRSPKVIILCDLSILVQWTTAVKSLHSPPGICFDIMGYDNFTKALREQSYEAKCRQADLIIVDEAQIFRNLRDRMVSMVDAIRKCHRVLLLSGTPIVNSAEDAVGFKYLSLGSTEVSLAEAAKGRVSHYDPSQQAHSRNRYPTIVRELVHVSMSWAQTLLYFAQRQNDFKLMLPDGDCMRVHRHVSNRYSVAIQSVANLPFPDHPEKSPKLMALVRKVTSLASHGPQVVYSSRIEKGVDVVAGLLQSSALRVAKVDGRVSTAERGKVVKAYNSGHIDVLILSPASARGVDLMGTYAFHLLEPHQNISEESQTLTRAVRYDSHKGMEDPKVRVFQYIATFPTAKPDQADVALMMAKKQEIFGRADVEDVTAAAMLAALEMEIKKEKRTVDEIQSQRNTEKHIEVKKCLDTIYNASILMPNTVAAGIPRASKEIAATAGKIRNTIDDFVDFAEGGWHSNKLELSAIRSRKLITDALHNVADKEGTMRGQDFKELVVKMATRLYKAPPVTKTPKKYGKTPRAKTPRAKTPKKHSKTPRAKTPRHNKPLKSAHTPRVIRSTYMPFI